MMSDDSENDGVYVESYENDVYYKKYKLLLEHCEMLQKQNEMLVHRKFPLLKCYPGDGQYDYKRSYAKNKSITKTGRETFPRNINPTFHMPQPNILHESCLNSDWSKITQVKRISKKRQYQIELFKNRLQEHGEDWVVIPKQEFTLEDLDVKPIFPPIATIIKEEKQEELPEEKPKSSRRSTKRKSSRTDKDPNAPKRPSNPFFQFCQEQRQILMEQINQELKPGEVEPTKQELTRQLAIKWKSLSGSDKQVYVDMYERSKEKYAVEMSEYNMKK